MQIFWLTGARGVRNWLESTPCNDYDNATYACLYRNLQYWFTNVQLVLHALYSICATKSTEPYDMLTKKECMHNTALFSVV